MSARSTFFEIIELTRQLAAEPLLTDKFPPTDIHNVKARVLRNGLLISTFSSLEGFLEERLEELLVALNRSAITYSMFDERMRDFLIVDAVTGLQTRIRFLDKSDRRQFAETHSLRLASFGSTPPSYSGLGFSPKGSNVGESDLASLLAVFGVEKSWTKLSQLASRLGATRLSLKDDFINCHAARNRAAHDSNTGIATADLLAHVDTCVVVAICVDLLLTYAVNCFLRHKTAALATADANVPNLSLRFLDEDISGSWRERSATTSRTVKRYADLNSGRAGALGRAGSFSLVVRDKRSMPIELAG